MFLSIPRKATLNKKRSSSVYDDETTSTEEIKVVFYNADLSIRFGTVSIAEAVGYFITKPIDAKEGDQIVYNNHTYTIMKVYDNWQFNKLVNLELIVK